MNLFENYKVKLNFLETDLENKIFFFFQTVWTMKIKYIFWNYTGVKINSFIVGHTEAQG